MLNTNLNVENYLVGARVKNVTCRMLIYVIMRLIKYAKLVDLTCYRSFGVRM